MRWKKFRKDDFSSAIKAYLRRSYTNKHLQNLKLSFQLYFIVYHGIFIFTMINFP